MVVSGIIVYSETYAKKAAKYLDGKVDYILVDAEKRFHLKNGDPSNIERRVKEVLKNSMWVYKGNDLTVDAVDIFDQLFKKLRGIGGKKILIIGAGILVLKLHYNSLKGVQKFIFAQEI